MMQKQKQVKTVSSQIGAERGHEVAEVSLKIFGHRPERMAFPGGKSRNAFLVDLGDSTWIFTKRDKPEDAQMEARVLKSLGETGLTPKFKAVSGRWTVQEYVPGTRMPVLLDKMGSMEERENVVSQALEALVRIQHAGQNSGLAQSLPKIGGDVSWFYNGVTAARRFSKRNDIKPPELDENALAAAMFTKRDEFIKYDARPGNVLMDGPRAVWFDWEDCGRGKAVEDFAFVLCDEWMSLDYVTEDKLIQAFLPEFARGLSKDAAYRQLVLYGTVHMSERMRLCLNFNVRDGGWWDRQACLAGDKVGNTPREMARQCSRLERWADIFPETRGYIDWVKDIKDRYRLPNHLETLSGAQAA